MAKLHQRLAPILSCFNNEYTWLMEWQTDQMPAASDLATGQISQYLGIRVATIAKDQCFYVFESMAPERNWQRPYPHEFLLLQNEEKVFIWIHRLFQSPKEN
jgi:hypothetical protein